MVLVGSSAWSDQSWSNFLQLTDAHRTSQKVWTAGESVALGHACWHRDLQMRARFFQFIICARVVAADVGEIKQQDRQRSAKKYVFVDVRHALVGVRKHAWTCAMFDCESLRPVTLISPKHDWPAGRPADGPTSD